MSLRWDQDYPSLSFHLRAPLPFFSRKFCPWKALQYIAWFEARANLHRFAVLGVLEVAGSDLFAPRREGDVLRSQRIDAVRVELRRVVEDAEHLGA